MTDLRPDSVIEVDASVKRDGLRFVAALPVGYSRIGAFESTLFALGPDMPPLYLDFVTGEWRRIAAAPAADSDGWIEWHGGVRPVARGIRVECRFRNGRQNGPSTADNWRWHWKEDGYDIVAYRIVKGTP